MVYDRLHRLFRLITLIQGSTTLNATRLAELLETTERTIYRDIDVLKETGIPISFDPEAEGYSIRKDFFLRPVDLTLEEAMALLLLADKVGAQQQVPHTAAAGKAAEKLRAILPRPIAAIMNERMPRTVVSLARSSDEPTADVYSAMGNAIARRRALECRYESPGQKPPDAAATFRFDPYDLYFGQRAWYVIGLHHGHGQIRTLKLCRFTLHKSLEHPYAIPGEFSLDRHFGQAWRMMPSGTVHAIRLHFDATVAENVADTHWHGSQQTDFREDGSLDVSFEIDGLEEIIWWILSYGPHCQVLPPPQLAARVATLAGAAAAQYAGGSVTELYKIIQNRTQFHISPRLYI